MEDILLGVIVLSVSVFLYLAILVLPIDYRSSTVSINCPACKNLVKNPIVLEKCGHQLCKTCVSTRLFQSTVLWQDKERNSFKVSSCPLCKEFFTTSGKMIF